jgi:predicted transcriptional regulator
MGQTQIPQSETAADATASVSEQLAKEAIERRFDLESWRRREIAKGIAQDDTGKLLLANLVMKRARRLLRQHAGKKTR